MAGLNQARGGVALTGFTLNEIIKQQQRGSWQRRNRCSTAWRPVYSLLGFFFFSVNEAVLRLSCNGGVLVRWNCVIKYVQQVFLLLCDSIVSMSFY